MDNLSEQKRDAELKLFEELRAFEMKNGAITRQIFITRDKNKELTDLRIDFVVKD